VKVNSLLTPADFAQQIESLVLDKGIPYTDALLLFSEKNSIEIETIASLVRQSSTLKNKLQTEGVANKTVKSNK
jgi:hypothetical protein